MKFAVIVTLLLACTILAKERGPAPGPIYHVPLVERNGSPLDISFHHRLDMLNAPSRVKRAYLNAGDKKISLRSELARTFTVKALNDWINHLGGQNLNMVHKHEFLDDISNLKGFAKLLQGHIIGRANAVMDKLALLDLKLKEQKLLEQEVEGIRVHPGNISSNLGNNLPWKDRLEEIVNNAAVYHTEFDVALKGMCTVVQKINFFVKNMENSVMDTRSIKQPRPETQYYPNEFTVLDNRPTFNALGPKVGRYNKRDPLMNDNLPFPGPSPKRVPTTHAITPKVAKLVKQPKIDTLNHSKNLLHQIAREDAALEKSNKNRRRRR